MGSGSRGTLVGIEGVDAVGKRTQTSLLASRLIAKGYTARTISFPDYGTVIGAEIRRFLHGGASYPAEVRHMLFAANRWEKKDELKSILAATDVVIVNRYSESNLVYGIANGLRLEWLANLEAGLPKPDLVVVLDAPIKDLRSRRRRTKDEYERDAGLQDRTRNAYLRLAADYGWKVIAATGDVEGTNLLLMAAVLGSLNDEGRTV